MWTVEWGGRATDFIPELLKTSGKPGRMAHAAKNAVHEALQCIGEYDPQSWVKVKVRGEEDAENPGLGKFYIEVHVIDQEQSPIQEELKAQQPIDMLRDQ